MADIDSVISKAKRLAALRDGATNEHEALAAANRLASLLEKHRLSMAEVESAGEDPQGSAEVFFDPRDALLSDYQRLPSWKRELAHVLSEHFGVALFSHGRIVGYTDSLRERRKWSMRMCGRRSDVEMMRFMFSWLVTEANRLAASQPSGRRWRNSWRYGFAVGIGAQLKEAREKAAEGSTQKAGIILRSRYDEAIAHLKKKHPKLKSSHMQGPDIDRDVATLGYQRGKSQHLGGALPKEPKDNRRGLLPCEQSREGEGQTT